MALVPTVKKGDWTGLNRIIRKLTSLVLGPDGTPTFLGLKLTGLTASRLLSSDADKKLASTDLNAWIAGTENQITVTDDTDGTVTLATPQDLHTGATPEFAGATLTGYSGLVHASAGVLSAGSLYVTEYNALVITD